MLSYQTSRLRDKGELALQTDAMIIANGASAAATVIVRVMLVVLLILGFEVQDVPELGCTKC